MAVSKTELMDAVYIPMTMEEKEQCEGYRLSDCCGGELIHYDICKDCGEHSANECETCDEEDCPNRKLL